MPSRRSTGRSWTPETTAIMLDMAREGRTQKEIALRLRRTPKAIERKVAKLRGRLSAMKLSDMALALNATAVYTLMNG